MNRNVVVDIDQSTWPPAPSKPEFPTSFWNGPHTVGFNIPEVLVTIGLLTTPAHSSGVSLSEFWAWVRYLHAVTDDVNLELSENFCGLDSHQKTILSDDFGIGFATNFLVSQLKLGPICDGKYFIERLSTSVGAKTPLRVAKRGPTKSPDYVARDSAGIWHVFECKGTQNSIRYSDNQIDDGISQKSSIIFPNSYTGQRLSCGLFIGTHDNRHSSRMKIVDPLNETPFEIGDNNIDAACDALLRGVTAKSLRLSGFRVTSNRVSAPDGPFPWSQPTTGLRERRRRSFTQGRDAASDNELANRTQRADFTMKKEKYRGREVKFDLASPIRLNEKMINSVRIRQGVNDRALKDAIWVTQPAEISEKIEAGWEETAGPVSLRSGRFNAQLQIGSLFASEIMLT